MSRLLKELLHQNARLENECAIYEQQLQDAKLLLQSISETRSTLYKGQHGISALVQELKRQIKDCEIGIAHCSREQQLLEEEIMRVWETDPY